MWTLNLLFVLFYLLLLVRLVSAVPHAGDWYCMNCLKSVQFSAQSFHFQNLLLFFFIIFFCVKLVHETIYEKILEPLVDVYKQVKIGDPLAKGTLLGPLHTRTSRENFEKGIQNIKSQVCPVS